ncbi:MAG: SusE domain-containing protein [Dysgonamonadaceae bacterium]|nr:SusE domain-containing protein [Dysgonamonadaceae bacterium]
MKKILNSILSMACLSVLFFSCETERDNPVLTSTVSKPVITSTVPNSLEITASNLEEIFTTIEFTPAVYSINIPATNVIQISLSNNFSEKTVSVGAATAEKSIELKTKSINSAVFELGAEAFIPVTVYLRVKTAVSATTGSPATELQISYSDPLELTITPYELQPAWVYAVGEFQGWGRTGNYGVVSITDNGIYVTYINFPKAESTFLILPDNSDSWDHKWGSDDGATLIQDGGADIKSPGAGWYRVTVDLNALSIKFDKFGNLGVVGTINNWGTPDVPMTYKPENHRFEATITCASDAEIKFRLNEDWGTNWGDNGKNIKIAEAGTYLVALDLTDLNKVFYTITKQ